jgi:hypothetical protein
MSVTATANDQQQGPLNDVTAVAAFEDFLSGDGQQGEIENKKEQGQPRENADEEDPEITEEDESVEPDDDDQQEPERFTVKVNGEEVQVTLDELRGGYLRTSDYTRKTQDLAAQRNTVAAELEQARSERAHYQQNLNAVLALHQQLAPQEPDWVALAEQNPAEYVRQRALHEQHYARQSALQAEQERLQQAQQMEESRLTAEQLQQEQQLLLEAIPQWKDEARAAQERKALIEFGLQTGFTADELSGVNDHRLVKVLRSAMLYQRAITKAKTGSAPQTRQMGSPRTAAPGSGRPPVTDSTRARQRLAKTGTVEDAAAALAHML